MNSSLTIFVLTAVALMAMMDRHLLLVISLPSHDGSAPSLTFTSGNISSPSSSSSSLAYQQSGGFFDDISDREWTMMQQRHASMFPNYVESYENYRFDESNIWFQDNFEPEFACRHEQRVGEKGEGGKWICDPQRIQEKKECLVYSIGCFGIVDFEQKVKELMPHCEIHVFDVKQSRNDIGPYEPLVAPYGEFHHWGISSQAHADAMPHRYKSMNQTVKELGHEGRTIDLFKIDCEGCEWFTYMDFFTSGVEMKQILIELHGAKLPNAKGLFHTLHDNGFAIFHKEANLLTVRGGKICMEYGFVKVGIEFFGNDLYSRLESASS